ncbi:hypothetical protein L873DRAFT_1293538 [Choiromyces venosus 120613-1]|uniref:Uncharacterized protein n=1 Tax=Choiromyces venosus 120613-1 TaxID=1336337 RepID=A0A3N4JHH6_9PEZI|nr:hypothetical protein L873DRAFT_1293538 [Choiromyces venosus 120613-1]
MSHRQSYWRQLADGGGGEGEGTDTPQSPQSQTPAVSGGSADISNPLLNPLPDAGRQWFPGFNANNNNSDSSSSLNAGGPSNLGSLPPALPVGGWGASRLQQQHRVNCSRGSFQAPRAAGQPPTQQSHAGFRGFHNAAPGPSSPPMSTSQQQQQQQQPPPAPRPTSPRPFSQCNITLAVDVSGSTAGRILWTETEFMNSIIHQLPQTSQQNTHILPWNHRAKPPCRLTDLRSLRGKGGTNPVSLLLSIPHLAALRSSGVWFLLTDGDINEWEVQRFSYQLSQESMHGVPVVVVVFGNTENLMPAQCNISVGLSPFAAVPHSALLFQDVQLHGRCYVLAAKGCFEGFNTATVEGGAEVEAVVLGDNTTWSDLPTIHPSTSFQDLIIPPPLELSPAEIALSDGLRVNFTTLFDTDLSDARVAELLGNQNHLQSILLNAQAQGQSANARNWLERNQTPVVGSRTDVGAGAGGGGLGSRAAQSVQQLTQALGGAHIGGGTGTNVDALRAELREAHRRRSGDFSQQQQQQQQYASPPYFPVSPRSSRDITIEAALESLARGTRSGVSGATLTSASPMPSAMNAPRANVPFNQALPRQTAPPPPPPPPPPPLDTTGAFKGECSLCYESDVLLSILFKRPTATTPLVPLLFPLALGSTPCNDVVSSWMCCHACSTLLVAQRETPLRETATATLPLVSWSRNDAVWRSVLHSALGPPNNPTASPLLPVLFLAVLEDCLEKKWSAQDGSEENRQRRAGLLYARDIIMKEVKVAGDDHRGSVGAWVSAVLLRPLRGEDSLVWKYPMEGFVLMTKLAKTHDRTLSQQEITKAVWRKLLHTIASRYATALNRSAVVGTEEQRKSSVRKYVHAGIALAMSGEENWMEGIRKLGFLGSGDLLALERLPGEVRWIENVAGNAMAQWLRWLDNVQGIVGGGAKECVEGIRRRWGVEVDNVLCGVGIDWEGEVL